jgi:type IV pilus assembly protein PilW
MNDDVLVINGTTCAVTSVTALSGTILITLENTTNATAGSKLACLGNWEEIKYEVTILDNKGTLDRIGTPTIADIVNLQAQYGISTSANSNQVTQWVDATGAWVTPSVTNRNRIKAVRIAIVARNGKYEADNVTTALSSWTGSASSPAPTINLNADTNWQHYRYRVFETIVPLRNVIWAKETL